MLKEIIKSVKRKYDCEERPLIEIVLDDKNWEKLLNERDYKFKY